MTTYRRFEFPPDPPPRWKIAATAALFAPPWSVLGAMATLDGGTVFGIAGGAIVGAAVGAIMGARIGALRDDG